MVIKNIAAICKRNGQVLLYEDGGLQWIGDGGSIFPLHGFPRLDRDTVLTVLDIPEAAQKKLFKDVRELPEIFDYSDTVRGENIIPDFGLNVGSDGMVLQPAKTSKGMVFFDPRYLSPLNDAAGDIQLYERQTADGHVYLVAKAGLLLQAIILPIIPRQQMVERLEMLLVELKKHQRHVSTMTDMLGQITVDESTGEVVE